jgi:hypothetical protein
MRLTSILKVPASDLCNVDGCRDLVPIFSRFSKKSLK